MNFQQITCSFDFPCVFVPRKGVGRYLFQISGLDKFAEGVGGPVVVKRELVDFATQEEQLLAQRSFFFLNLSVSRTAEGASNHCEEQDQSGWVVQVPHLAETPDERTRLSHTLASSNL